MGLKEDRESLILRYLYIFRDSPRYDTTTSLLTACIEYFQAMNTPLSDSEELYAIELVKKITAKEKRK